MTNLEKVKHQSWLDGKIVAINADCLEVMKNENIDADLLLSDPPYNTTACHFEWDILSNQNIWDLFRKSTKSPIVLFGSQPFTSKLICSNLKDFKYCWIWNKTTGANFMNLKNQPFKVHEEVIVFAKNSNFTFNPQRISRSDASLKRYPIGKAAIIKKIDRKIAHYNIMPTNANLSEDGTKHPISILDFPKRAEKRDGFTHPTQKSTKLCEYLVKTYANENDLVFDAFSGSFTTAIACIRTKRRFIGCELDPIYFEKACERIDAELKQLTLF